MSAGVVAPHGSPGVPQLRDYRDAHRGADILVCGCGPSLSQLESPAAHLSIGVNDVGRLFDPTYLVVLNPRAQFKADRYRYVESSNARALFTQLDTGSVRPPVVRVRLGRYGGVGDAWDALDYTQNSPYVAVCLAAYMGAARIGLIGVDFTDHHFFAATGRHPLAARLGEIDAQYGRLHAALAARGIALYNLSSVSRLRSLPRARIDAAGAWEPLPQDSAARRAHDAIDASSMPAHAQTAAARARRATVAMPAPLWCSRTALSGTRPAAPALSPTGGTGMKIAVERRGGGVVDALLDALAASAQALGHSVTRDARTCAHDPNALTILWNGHGCVTRGPRLYCEHGWLPRSDYQISPRGINAESHLAPFVWDGVPLSAEEDAALDARFDAIKSATYHGHYRYMQAAALAPVALPEDFLLVPLQIESDSNILRHAPASLRSMQALVDRISDCDPPWPVIFKQHPCDERHGNRHLRLRLRRAQDRLWPQAQGNIHQMLGGGRCRGVITINSNVAHDALLWDVPVVALGRNLWPEDAGSQARTAAVTPFLTVLPEDWSRLAQSLVGSARQCRRAYAQHLIRHQWTLAEARDPARVDALIQSALIHSARNRSALNNTALNHSAPRHAPAEPRPRPPRVEQRPAVQRIAQELPVLNVVAEHKGWLFEQWKQALAAGQLLGYRVQASLRPLPQAQAQAWLFVRASEAARSPDPMRSVVQLHDDADAAHYREGGARAAVARCAALALSHPAQIETLRDAGIDVALRRTIVQPVGWQALDADPPLAALEAPPLLAWVGRPAQRTGAEISGLPVLLDALPRVRTPLRLLLIGERLEPAAAQLRALGIDARAAGTAHYPLARSGAWVGRFDALALTDRSDAGPWPLFDALRAGVPVAALPVGWAPQLLADGEAGALAQDAETLAAAIDALLAQRAHWRARRAATAPRVAEFGLDAWVQANLALAASLVPQTRRAVA